jgi:hypothetical protein
MTWQHVLALAGYSALFLACLIGLLWWRKKNRKTRRPLPEQLRLLRGPGESQLKIVREFEEGFPFAMVFSALLPAMIGFALLYFAMQLPRPMLATGFVVSLLAFAICFFIALRKLAAAIQENGNRYLGYFGERFVAEHLEPLKIQGWRIFHDVPGEVDGRQFNIDHVAVGPQGVFVIETKTRRKGKARPGYEDHKVAFDGRELDWPWGRDAHGLDQAERNAVWLAATIKKETGERMHVSPVLALPGWWVDYKPSRESRLAKVTNPKGLPKLLTNGPVILSDQQIEAVAAKLDARCRDVEY